MNDVEDMLERCSELIEERDEARTEVERLKREVEQGRLVMMRFPPSTRKSAEELGRKFYEPIRQRDEARAAFMDSRAEVVKLRAVLKMVEWAGEADTCPACESTQEEGHGICCMLADEVE